MLLIVGLVLWCVILFRGLRRNAAGRALRQSALPLLLQRCYRFRCSTRLGCSPSSRTDFAIADFWRFWVVHLWVEDFLELFTTIMVAYIFVLLGVVSEKTATRVVYLDVLLYSVGGVVGTMHHHVFQRHAGHPHGAGSVLLGRRGRFR